MHDIETYQASILRLYHQEEPIYEMFKQRLSQKGIDVCGVELIPRSQSCFAVDMMNDRYRNVPYLNLIAKDRNVYEAIVGEPKRMELLDSSLTRMVFALWKEVCIQAKVSSKEFYDNDMYIGVKDGSLLVYEYIARTYKREVKDILKQFLSIEPRNLYASSMPSIEIVYEKEDYDGIKNKMDMAVSLIQSFFYDKAYEISGQHIAMRLQVHFWHPGMEGYNGYGLARED